MSMIMAETLACGHVDYSDDSEFDLDEECFFSRTYQPLSNLPTPPPSCRSSLAAQSPNLHDGGLKGSALLGPAIHLINLIPPSASLAVPSVSLVHEILTRAKVSMDTVALAVCILDTLSSKFPLNWRLLCPLAPRADLSPGHVKRHSIPASPLIPTGTGSGSRQNHHHQRPPQMHIDSVNPEVIILTALMLAVKFLEDCQEPTRYYASAWGGHIWTCEQINVTERCIMESLGYRILPLWDQQLIRDALSDMERAGQQAVGGPFLRSSSKTTTGDTSSSTSSTSTSSCVCSQERALNRNAIAGTATSMDDRHKRSASSGIVLLARGGPPTPVETPTFGTGGTAPSPVADHVRAVFGSAPVLVYDALHLPQHLPLRPDRHLDHPDGLVRSPVGVRLKNWQTKKAVEIELGTDMSRRVRTRWMDGP